MSRDFNTVITFNNHKLCVRALSKNRIYDFEKAQIAQWAETGGQGGH